MEIKKSQMINFGLHRSEPDARDYNYAYVGASVPKLPSKFMLDLHPVRDQGHTGACVGFAGARMQEGDGFTRNEKDVLSPLYLYAKCKAIDNLPGEGTTLRHAMKVLTSEGICKESLYKYEDTDNTRNLVFPDISEKANLDGQSRRCKGYARLYSTQNVKEAIYNENGVMAGVLVTTDFKNTKDGVVGTPNGFMLGMHAICLVGWDDKRIVSFTDGDGKVTKHTGVIYFMNSWGKEWGENGMGIIPYDFFDLAKVTTYSEIKLVEECWTTFHTPKDDKDDPDYHKNLKGNGGVTPLPKPEETETNSDEIRITLGVNNPVMIVDGKEHKLSSPPAIIKGSTMIPLRAVSDAFGAKVESWDNKTKKAVIVLKKDDILKIFKEKEGK